MRQTSSSHGPDGYITSVPEVLDQGIRRLRDKLIKDRDEFLLYRLDADPEADILLVAYGVTARAAEVCVQKLRAQAHHISLLVLQCLYPVPESLLQTEIGKVSRVVVVEMNLGQYVREIERVSGAIEVEFLGRMDGELLPPDEILGAIVQ